jgi:hypothetical protein
MKLRAASIAKAKAAAKRKRQREGDELPLFFRKMLESLRSKGARSTKAIAALPIRYRLTLAGRTP